MPIAEMELLRSSAWLKAAAAVRAPLANQLLRTETAADRMTHLAPVLTALALAG